MYCQVQLEAATTLSGGIQFQFFSVKNSNLLVSGMLCLCIFIDFVRYVMLRVQ